MKQKKKKGKKQTTKLYVPDACKILIRGKANEENTSKYLQRFFLGFGIFFNTRIYFSVCFLNINLFIYLVLAVLSLRCCARAFSSCGQWGLLFVTVHGLLIAVASLVAEHGL